MRRRSASALSTAAVRLVSRRVTWAAWSASALGPSRLRATDSSSRATPSVIHGATSTSPRMPAMQHSHAPPPLVISKK